jgi:predicted amidohydrolase YtcJ
MADERGEIFKARRVIALTEAEPEAFAVLGERIVAVGSAADLTRRFPEAALTDVGDSVIVPGFNDAHIHPSIVAEDLLNLDVSSSVVGSLAELTRKVLDQAVATSPGTWIKGTRYDDAKMVEGRVLTRWDLDEVAPIIRP